MQIDSEIVTIDRFHANKLNNKRRIFVYLPVGYKVNSSKRYPVLYMHAGQRAFGQAQTGTESWNIHKTADRLIAEGKMEAIIIVAISHVRPVTANEFYHYALPAEEALYMACSGLDYEDFIVRDLKPYIDVHFRTLPDPRNTGLIGSSAGGLSTYHIGFRNPSCFGKLIMLSPYFIKAQLDEISENKVYEEMLYLPYEGKLPLKIWMDIGDAEGLFLPRHVRDVVEGFISCGYQYGKEIAYLLQPNAAHQEADWAHRVDIPLLYMFGKQSSPVSLHMHGRNTVGLKGMKVHINTVIQYENGYAMSVLNGTYRVEHPDILEVQPDGTIIANRVGETTVFVLFEGLEVSRTYTVIEELSEHVAVRISVEVPPGSPQDEVIYGGMGMKLTLEGINRYSGSFLVPRDSGYRFRFTRGFRKFETDAEGNVLPNRVFRADEDITLHYKIERWEQGQTYVEERSNHADTTF